MISIVLLCIMLQMVLSIPTVTIVILTQKPSVHNDLALELERSILASSRGLDIKPRVVNTVRDYPDIMGSWTIFPICQSLVKKYNSDWFLFVEPETVVSMSRMSSFLSSEDPDTSSYFGYALHDTLPTIIHHFYGYDQHEQFSYPDWSAGMLLSGVLLKNITKAFATNIRFNDFSIDPKHEFARYVMESLNVRLQSRNSIFCLFPTSNTCVTQYKAPTYSSLSCSDVITDDSFYVAVKTYSDFHRSRLVVIKRTWANSVANLEYISDIEDQFVPTVTLGVKNTEKGHCAKSFAILQHFNKKVMSNPWKWLVIGDDDTLLSVPRLKNLLKCYNYEDKLIIGERYGYGFNIDGTTGYDYPTGGSSMIFSRAAVQEIIKTCSCPQPDSPDDMIIGMCAAARNIPVIHSPAFHQARTIDYAPDYIKKLQPISFHKLEDIDPYEVFVNYLKEESPVKTHVYQHTEL